MDCIYQNDLLVSDLTKSVMDSGQSIFQIHKVGTDLEHVAYLLDKINPKQNAKVLDAGCGVGAVSEMMLKMRPDLEFTLLNISQSQLDQCHGDKKIHSSFDRIPVDSGTYDVVMFNYSIGHGYLDAVFTETSRVLKDDGVMFIYDVIGEGFESLSYKTHATSALIKSACSKGFDLDVVDFPQASCKHMKNIADEKTYKMMTESKPILYKFIKNMSSVESVMERHEKVVLMFSGGKDSMACLYLMRKFLDKITVLWINTGDAFPEMIALMERVKKLVPQFVEVKSNQPSYVKNYGMPSDVVPISNLPYGMVFTGEKTVKINSYLDCCAANIWKPGHDAIKQMGATLIIRGQRNQEAHKSPVRSGNIIDGIEYLMPIETWSSDEVMAYLKVQDFDMPEFYSLEHTSLDCMHCTAYCAHHADKFEYMKKNHYTAYKETISSMGLIAECVQREINPLNKIMEG